MVKDVFLKDYYAQHKEHLSIPKDKNILESSRFFIDHRYGKDQRLSNAKKATLHLLSALGDFAQSQGCQEVLIVD